jgi:hypothetical protein
MGRTALSAWSRGGATVVIAIIAALALGQTACAATLGEGGLTQRRALAVFDNTAYPNVDLEAFGLVRSAVVYETTAQASAIASGRLPDQVPFERSVRARATVPGPVVLDYEDLYLTGPPTAVAWHLRVLTALARWAHHAAARSAIGFYGLLDHTAPAYISLARQLAPLEDAFFPSMYTFDDNRAKWRLRLEHDVALAHRIDSGTPVYPYLWPQYHQGTPRAGQFINGGYWAFQLATVANLADGFVVWSQEVANESDGWVSATQRFMRSLSPSPGAITS